MFRKSILAVVTGGLALGMASMANAALVFNMSFDNSTVNTPPNITSDSGQAGTNNNAGGSVTTGVTGAVGQAYTYSGAAYSAFGSAGGTGNTTNFTYAMWINTTDTGTIKYAAMNTGSAQNAFLYNWSGNTAANSIAPWNFGAFSGGPIFDGNPASILVTTDGTWHHYAWTYDGLNVRMYKDGAAFGGPVAAAFTYYHDSSQVLGSAAGVNGFDASLDDFRYYNETLTAGQIATLAGAVPEPASLSVLALVALGLLRRRKA